MLKLPITFINFDGEEVTETHYFNISKPELIKLEVENRIGFGGMIERIIEAGDNKTLIEEFERIILLAYGEKSEDGRRFIKTGELSKEFSQTGAYEKLFMDLASDVNYAVEFLKGILPKEIAATISADTVANPPAPAAPPVPRPA